MSKATNTKDALIATEWILNHLDWTQQAFFRGDQGQTIQPSDTSIEELLQQAKSVCLVGALRLVDTTEPVRDAAWTQLHNTVGWVYAFNDAPGRTKEQVLKAVRKAIESAP